jgi:uncharacterized membrane protein
MKPAIRSKTIIGVIIAVAPQVARLFGMDVSDDEITAILDALMTLGGAAYAIYGRWTANEKISGVLK